jgi:small subunit ribosomal protein S19e
MSIYEIPAQEYNDKLAEALKKIPEFKMPEWALFVKTGVCKARPPENNDWWYNRAASILRQIYIKGVVGVNRLRNKYGDRKNRGMKPEIFAKGSGKIIRTILQSAEKAGMLEKVLDSKDGKRKGRKITQAGKKFLEDVK